MLCSIENTVIFLFTRPTLLLENYQPWLDLKVPSKVDASLSEVTHKQSNTLPINCKEISSLVMFK